MQAQTALTQSFLPSSQEKYSDVPAFLQELSLSIFYVFWISCLTDLHIRVSKVLRSAERGYSVTISISNILKPHMIHGSHFNTRLLKWKTDMAYRWDCIDQYFNLYTKIYRVFLSWNDCSFKHHIATCYWGQNKKILAKEQKPKDKLCF